VYDGVSEGIPVRDLTKFQPDGFLFDRVYITIQLCFRLLFYAYWST